MSEERRKPDDYLWDGQGEPDPEVQRLERLLSPFRYEPKPAAVLPLRRSRRRAWIVAAAAVVAAAAIALILLRPPRRQGHHLAAGDPSWAVKTLVGAPTCDGDPIPTEGRIPLGRWLATDDTSAAEVEVADIGRVRVEPRSRVRIVETHKEKHRLELQLGAIHATIKAPPRLFVVDTPSARAIDLGCEYDLVVEANGDADLQVSSGWVELAGGGRSVVVPAGARCVTRAGEGPGIPWFPDSHPAFVQAIRAVDEDPAEDAVTAALEASRVRDTLSLWHLVSRVEGPLRQRVVDRILALIPGLPGGVTRDALIAGDPASLEAWRHKLMSTWGIPPSDVLPFKPGQW